jgi:hypothetical protein
MAFANTTGEHFFFSFLTVCFGSLYSLLGIIENPATQMRLELRIAIKPRTNLSIKMLYPFIPEHSSGIFPALFFLSLAYT